MTAGLAGFVGSILIAAGLAKARSSAEIGEFIGALFRRVAVPRHFGRLVVATELAIGWSLLVGVLVGGWLMAIAAFGALALASGFVAVQVLGAARHAPACQCFGSIAKGEARFVEVIRATVVLLASGVLVADGFPIEPLGGSQSRVAGELGAGASLGWMFVLVTSLVSLLSWFNANRPMAVHRRRYRAARTV